MELFAKAVKLGIVFQTPRGARTPQEIWRMPLVGNNDFNLDTVSSMLLHRIDEAQGKSLVITVGKVDPEDELRLEVLKYIIKDKRADMAAAQQAAERKRQREELQQDIAEKQREVRKERTLEEMQRELASLKD